MFMLFMLQRGLLREEILLKLDTDTLIVLSFLIFLAIKTFILHFLNIHTIV